MCTLCLVGVMCDLPIRRCVSGLGMYPCCRCAMTVGNVVHVRGSCWSPLSVHVLFIDVIIIGSLRWLSSVGRYRRVYRFWASASSGAYLRVCACIIYRFHYYRITAVAFLDRSLQKGLPVLGIYIARCVSTCVAGSRGHVTFISYYILPYS